MAQTPHTPESLAHAALTYADGDVRKATRFAVTSALEELDELSQQDLELILASVLVINQE